MGQLIRILTVLLALWLVVHLIRRALARRRRSSPNQPSRMVACVVCGMHIPEPDAVQAAGRFYCCEEHRQTDGN